MKIYCSQRNKTDEEILDSFVGQDIWVLVTIPRFVNREYFIQILSKCEGTQDPSYMVDKISKDYIQWSNDGKIHIKHGVFRDVLPQLLHIYDMVLVKPLELITTDELFVYDDY